MESPDLKLRVRESDLDNYEKLGEILAGVIENNSTERLWIDKGAELYLPTVVIKIVIIQ